MEKIIKTLLVAGIVAVVGLGCVYSWQMRQPLDYTQCLDETAFTLNREAVPMRELGFYILYEEREVEEQAMLYNPDNTRDYWNLHVDGVFIQTSTKNTVMDMAVHDWLFYQMAQEEGLQLDADEEMAVRSKTTDFFMDLLDEQVENMPVSEEDITVSIRRIALAEKCQQQLADREGCSAASYDWDGNAYEQLLEQQELKVNDRIWDRITVGNISLRHGRANFINGMEDT